MKKILQILILFNVLIQAKGLTAESCIGYTDKIISSGKKSDVVNLQVLCDKGCGKACVEKSILEEGKDSIIGLQAKFLEKGCNAKFPYAKACYWRARTDKSKEQAYQEKACNLGFSSACEILASEVEDKDFTKYIEYIKKSCIGDREGMDSITNCYNLGYYYYGGRGVKKNYKQAAKWYQIAADEGNAGAQVNLGFMYVMGQGVKQDKIKTYQYWMKAAKQGNENAQKNLDTLCKNNPWACK